MASFTTADVKRLREATGAGMLDCKNALTEADGDFERAIELLRVKGQAKAAKRGAERTAANGLVAASGGAMIQLGCETDFVAKNADFQRLAADIAALAESERLDDLDALKAASLPDGRTVVEAIDAAGAVIGEKLELTRVAVLAEPVATYLHRRSADLPPQVGVLVSYRGDEQAARGTAMQVAALRPRWLERNRCPRRPRRQGARDRRGHRPRGGQARAGDGQDRRGPRHRLLQGRRPARSAQRPGPQDLGALGARGGGHDRHRVRPLRGGRGLAPRLGQTAARNGWAASARDGRRVVQGLDGSARRVLLKLSGEVFGGGSVGLDPDVVHSIASQVAEVARSGVQLAIVVGGGNFFRGAELQQAGMDRARGDYMGMLGTVMNCLALQDFLEQQGCATRVQTAIAMGQVAEPYIPRRAIRHLEKGRVVIFGAGAGMPYFSTDTVAAQRALEIGCDSLVMAKNGVDGVYDADPRRTPGARKFARLEFGDALALGLRVVDASAFSLCMENKLPIVVFNLLEDGNIARVVRGEPIGTVVGTGVGTTYADETPGPEELR